MKLEIHPIDPDFELDFNEPDLQEYLPIIARKSFILDKCKNDKELLILRGHIAIEYFLENIIEKYLPNGKKLNGNNLNFARKLAVVESFDILEPDILLLIKKINSLRNKCAHKLEYQILDTNIEDLGSCIPDVYKKLKLGGNPLLDIISTILINLAYSGYLIKKKKK